MALNKREHRIMIELGNVYAIFLLRDLSEVPGVSVKGSWKNPASGDDTSDGSELSLTSSSKEYLRWTWTEEAPDTIVIGVESDQSKSSHKEGDGVFMQELVKLYGAKRTADGIFSSGNEKGRGRLTYKTRLFEAGNILWSVGAY